MVTGLVAVYVVDGLDEVDLKILGALEREPLNFNRLVNRVGEARPTVSRHLKKLVRRGLVERREERRESVLYVHYSITRRGRVSLGKARLAMEIARKVCGARLVLGLKDKSTDMRLTFAVGEGGVEILAVELGRSSEALGRVLEEVKRDPAKAQLLVDNIRKVLTGI